jgi:hypothetical protein
MFLHPVITGTRSRTTTGRLPHSITTRRRRRPITTIGGATFTSPRLWNTGLTEGALVKPR